MKASITCLVLESQIDSNGPEQGGDGGDFEELFG